MSRKVRFITFPTWSPLWTGTRMRGLAFVCSWSQKNLLNLSKHTWKRKVRHVRRWAPSKPMMIKGQAKSKGKKRARDLRNGLKALWIIWNGVWTVSFYDPHHRRGVRLLRGKSLYHDKDVAESRLVMVHLAAASTRSRMPCYPTPNSADSGKTSRKKQEYDDDRKRIGIGKW